jgi:hypothetical protein
MIEARPQHAVVPPAVPLLSLLRGDQPQTRAMAVQLVQNVQVRRRDDGRKEGLLDPYACVWRDVRARVPEGASAAAAAQARTFRVPVRVALA